MKEGTETLLNYEPLQPIDRARSHAFASATGALAGLTVGAVAAVVTRGHALPAVINSLPRMLVVSGGAGFGVSLIANAVTGGRLGQTIAQATWGQRHEIAFGVAHLAQPAVLLDTRRAFADARHMQLDRWGEAMHIDDGVDALRHSFAAADLSARLTHDRRMSAPKAIATVMEIGDAHEADGLVNYAGSSAMDRHNNRVGAEIGIALAAQLGRIPTVNELFDAVRAALSSGELTVLDGAVPRDSSAADMPPQR